VIFFSGPFPVHTHAASPYALNLFSVMILIPPHRHSPAPPPCCRTFPFFLYRHGSRNPFVFLALSFPSFSSHQFGFFSLPKDWKLSCSLVILDASRESDRRRSRLYVPFVVCRWAFARRLGNILSFSFLSFSLVVIFPPYTTIHSLYSHMRESPCPVPTLCTHIFPVVAHVFLLNPVAPLFSYLTTPNFHSFHSSWRECNPVTATQ